MGNVEFLAWPKIPRVENRKEFYTEKIDGTNACVIWSYADPDEKTLVTYLTEVGPISLWCQSRSRFITPDDDNFGFAYWARNCANELLKLGEGHHFGEWWGQGIQRGYGMDKKVFSLFNTKRWNTSNPNRPSCCSVVPTIHASSVEEAKQKLIDQGSLAAPGFMDVEGIVVFEYQTSTMWKAIINK